MDKNFNTNIITIECYEWTSAIGKEVKAIPATFDFYLIHNI